MAKKIVLLRRFYVYGIKVDGIVRYVGKGCNGRIYAHVVEAKSGNHCNEQLSAALRDGRGIEYILFRDDLDERGAFKLEAAMIAKHKDLWNKPFHAAHALKSRWLDPAARAKHSAAIKAKWQDSDFRESTRANMREAAKVRPRTTRGQWGRARTPWLSPTVRR